MVPETAGGGAEVTKGARPPAEPPEGSKPRPDPVLVRVAWLALLLAPVEIYWLIATGHQGLPWTLGASLGAVGAVGVVARARPVTRPLGGFLLALGAFLGGEVVVTLVQRTNAWSWWTGRATLPHQVLAYAVLEAMITCPLMALTLLRSGCRRRDVFLAVGELRRGAFGRWGLSWAAILPLAAAVFALPLLVNLAFTVRPELGLLGKAVRALPAALAFGAINATQEEFRFRMVFLARLLPVVGADRAVVMTAVLFGLAHWGGHPSGASGVVLAFLAGYGLAASMVETKGAAWAWTVHAVLDVLIYGSLVMAVR